MSTAERIMLGLGIASPLFTIIWWLWRRPVARLDAIEANRLAALEAAVFGDAGVKTSLHKFVTRDEMDRRFDKIDAHMNGLSEEGIRREERIIDAINNQTLVVGSEVGEIKTDLRAQAARIDAMFRDPR